MWRRKATREATFTGEVLRGVFHRDEDTGERSFIVEMANDKDVKTFVAYDHNAVTLSSFLTKGKWYVVDYEPWSDSPQDGQILSARDRN